MQDSGMSYSTIKDTIIQMKKANLWIVSKDEKKRTITSLFPTADFIDGDGSIVVFMWADILLHLLQLQVWTQLDYKHVMNFKSVYTLRMYELLCKVRNQDHAVFDKSLDELNEAFDTKYLNITDIKRNIIDLAHEELKQRSKIAFEYKIKYKRQNSGRPRAVSIEFYVTKNIAQPTLF
jgi:plasmid replication initiation protein